MISRSRNPIQDIVQTRIYPQLFGQLHIIFHIKRDFTPPITTFTRRRQGIGNPCRFSYILRSDTLRMIQMKQIVATQTNMMTRSRTITELHPVTHIINRRIIASLHPFHRHPLVLFIIAFVRQETILCQITGIHQ
jgi:hypothetical protein